MFINITTNFNSGTYMQKEPSLCRGKYNIAILHSWRARTITKFIEKHSKLQLTKHLFSSQPQLRIRLQHLLDQALCALGNMGPRVFFEVYPSPEYRLSHPLLRLYHHYKFSTQTNKQLTIQAFHQTIEVQEFSPAQNGGTPLSNI